MPFLLEVPDDSRPGSCRRERGRDDGKEKNTGRQESDGSKLGM